MLFLGSATYFAQPCLAIDVLEGRILLTYTHADPVGLYIDGEDVMNFNAIPYQVETRCRPVF
jgi:hypothetical protein